MADPASAPDLDVFLSYKREEKDVAEALAKFLITRGYDVWWDDALLAGENFADIVHAELRKSRAVVVLWSKQARTSHWVQAEAELALQQGTLINTVIDAMPFEGIPPEFSNIQAVRLGDDVAAFHEAVAAAIARKGANPLLAQRSHSDAGSKLAGKTRDTELFSVIANSVHVGDFEEYLALFGDTGQFTSLARRRIEALKKAEAERKGLWRRLQIGGVAAVGLIAALANMTTILAFLNPPAPQPQPVPSERATVEVAVDATPADQPEPEPEPEAQPDPEPNPELTLPPVTLPDGTLALAPPEEPNYAGLGLGPRSGLDLGGATSLLPDAWASLVLTEPDGNSRTLPSAATTWTSAQDIVTYSYDASFAFDGGPPAKLSFGSWTLTSTQARVDLSADPADPLLAGVTRIAAISADGVSLTGTSSDTTPAFIFKPSMSLFDTAFDSLATAASIELTLGFADGRTATLNLTTPPDPDALRKALGSSRSTYLDIIRKSLRTEPSTP